MQQASGAASGDPGYEDMATSSASRKDARVSYAEQLESHLRTTGPCRHHWPTFLFGHEGGRGGSANCEI